MQDASTRDFAYHFCHLLNPLKQLGLHDMDLLATAHSNEVSKFRKATQVSVAIYFG